MSQTGLSSTDIALLGTLRQGPIELGNVPADAVERLAALGLARKVLGSCKITRAGQLAYHRQSFSRASRRKVARVSHCNPLFLQEDRFCAPVDRAVLKIRRDLEWRPKRATRLPRWLKQIASRTLRRLRPFHELWSGPAGGGRATFTSEPHKGSK